MLEEGAKRIREEVERREKEVRAVVEDVDWTLSHLFRR